MSTSTCVGSWLVISCVVVILLSLGMWMFISTMLGFSCLVLWIVLWLLEVLLMMMICGLFLSMSWNLVRTSDWLLVISTCTLMLVVLYAFGSCFGVRC